MRIVSSFIFFASILLLLFSGASCFNSPVDSEPEQYTMELSLIDTGTREVYLKLSPGQYDGSITITRNDSIICSALHPGKDTVLIDENLEPERNYRYKASLIKDGRIKYTTNEIETRTLGVTNNNFNCYLDTLGLSGGANDVCIINEHNVWVAGTFLLPDTGNSQQGYETYNAAQWNGTQWKYYNMLSSAYDDNGKELWLSKSELSAVFAFGINDIWFSNGIQLLHWDGQNCTRVYVGPEFYRKTRIMKIWGTGANDIYSVGTNGYIIHYDGHTMRRMTVDTDNHIWDIFGTGNEKYTVASYSDGGRNEGTLLKYDGGSWKTIMKGWGITTGFQRNEHMKTQLMGPFLSGCIFQTNTIYVGGQYMYQCVDGRWDYFKHMPENDIDTRLTTRTYISAVTGNGPNDMFFCGWGRFLWHYNGEEWKDIYKKFSSVETPHWTRISAKGNIAFVVGHDSFRAYVLRIYR